MNRMTLVLFQFTLLAATHAFAAETGIALNLPNLQRPQDSLIVCGGSRREAMGPDIAGSFSSRIA